jgi:hypothetical protein
MANMQCKWVKHFTSHLYTFFVVIVLSRTPKYINGISITNDVTVSVEIDFYPSLYQSITCRVSGMKNIDTVLTLKNTTDANNIANPDVDIDYYYRKRDMVRIVSSSQLTDNLIDVFDLKDTSNFHNFFLAMSVVIMTK